MPYELGLARGEVNILATGAMVHLMIFGVYELIFNSVCMRIAFSEKMSTDFVEGCATRMYYLIESHFITKIKKNKKTL